MLRFLKQHRQKLALVVIIYLLLAVAYSVVVPIGRGADEWAHYWYAQFIAENGRLPANPAEREAAGYKSDWPPLYHLFAAGLTAWINTDGPPTFKYRADSIRRELAPSLGPEAILHTLDEQFPWQQEILVWHLGRFLSIGFTTGTLVITYLITLELFAQRRQSGKQKSRGAREQGSKSNYQLSIINYQLPIASTILAVLATAILAFNPRFLFTGMLFNYDSLTLFLSSLFLWLSIRVAKGYHWQWGYWGLGALAGLALVTKYLTAFLPVIILVIVWRQRRRGAGEQGSRGAAEPESSRRELRKRKTIHHSSFIIHHFLKPLTQAGLAYLFIVSWWFGYLLINFNEIETYGPVLGTVAPLLRGDGSDRTVEGLFTWFSGGQAPPPAHIDRQSYTAWQIIIELPITYWGNPIVRPYPLNWFILLMTLVVIVSLGGLALFWWGVKGNRFWLNLLLLYCALPVPFMVVRLFGARDALEAVQGRHILFLAGPAAAILLALGWWSVSHILGNILRVFPYIFTAAPYIWRVMFMGLSALLLTGSMAQLIFMAAAYPSPLPVQTTPYTVQANIPIPTITLPGGTALIDYQVSPAHTPYSILHTPYSSLLTPHALKVTLVWQAGNAYAPEDYQTELQLLDAAGMPQSGWLAYQTQARYPTRAWENGDTIFDAGYLPLVGLAPGEYALRLRLLGATGPVSDWHTLTTYTLNNPVNANNGWSIWRNGKVTNHPTFQERETIQIINYQLSITNYQLFGPTGKTYLPTLTGSHWANFIVEPDWPAGDYYISGESRPVLSIAHSGRNFNIPEITQPLDVNFEGKIKLLGYHLPSRRVEPGEGLPITLYWQGLERMGEEFVIFNRLLDNPQAEGQQTSWGGYDRLARENYSTLLWAPGEIITDGFAVPVDPDAPGGVYTLSLGWYRRIGGDAESLPIIDPQSGEPTQNTAVTIGPIKVGGPPPGITVDRVSPQFEIDETLGDKIRLLGIDEETQADESGLNLTFYWESLDPVDTDYTVFVHIRNANGDVAAQKDGPPAAGAYPTSLWDAGEIIKDSMTIPLNNLAPGRYELVAGMYDFTTGERLPVEGQPDNTIALKVFEIK